LLGAAGETAGGRFRAAFAAGWWRGFGFFLAGLWSLLGQSASRLTTKPRRLSKDPRMSG